jgi:hypothetical protein
MKSRSRIKYEIDPENRLVVSSKGIGKKIPGFRTVVDGTFCADKNNELVYSVTGAGMMDSSVRRLLRFARNDDGIRGRGDTKLKKIRLKGTWSMDEGHHLVYQLEGARTKTGRETLKLSGEVIALEGGRIGVALATKNSEGKETIYVLSLTGALRVNKYNELSYEVKREYSRSNTLTLRGKWEINKHHEIIYTYWNGWKQGTCSLVVKGHWDVLDRTRIVYWAEGHQDKGCEFGVELGRYDSSKRALVYTVGIGVRPQSRTLIFKGKWRVRKGVGLTFEMMYRDSEVYSMKFGATCTLSGHTECSVELKDTRGKGLGIEVELKRELFNGMGQAFVRGLASEKACELVAGVGTRW